MLVAVLVTLLLAVGFAACGGGDSSSSTTAEAGGQGQSASKPSGNAAQQGDAKSGGSEGGSGSAEGQSGGSGGGGATDFVPRHHHDSGGGSQQYLVKGGDNSVQEFGVEADAAERDAAAAALHDFLDARAEGNWAAACDYLSKSTLESFEKLAAQTKEAGATGCEATLRELTNPSARRAMKAEAAEADVGSLRIEGERAFVIYTAERTVFAMPVANQGGVWKVASLAATPIS